MILWGVARRRTFLIHIAQSGLERSLTSGHSLPFTYDEDNIDVFIYV